MDAGSHAFQAAITEFRMITEPKFMAWGSMIFHMVVKCPAPSILAASYISWGTELKAFIIMMLNMPLVHPGITKANGVSTHPRALITI